MAIIGTRIVELRFSVSGWARQRVEIPENITNGELEKMLKDGNAGTSILGGDFEIYDTPGDVVPSWAVSPDEIDLELELSDYEVEAT